MSPVTHANAVGCHYQVIITGKMTEILKWQKIEIFIVANNLLDLNLHWGKNTKASLECPSG